MKKGYVYILSNKKNGTLYIGVTSNLERRIYEHKNKMIDGFSKKYGLTSLVYYEEYGTIVEAIDREKKLKGGSRKAKILLIEDANPDRLDLLDNMFD